VKKKLPSIKQVSQVPRTRPDVDAITAVTMEVGPKLAIHEGRRSVSRSAGQPRSTDIPGLVAAGEEWRERDLHGATGPLGRQTSFTIFSVFGRRAGLAARRSKARHKKNGRTTSVQLPAMEKCQARPARHPFRAQQGENPYQRSLPRVVKRMS